MSINIIASICPDGGIGYKNSLPWTKEYSDLKYFKEKTMGSVVIMGRKTYESIGSPLSGRINVVISKTIKISSDSEQSEPYVFKTLADAIKVYKGKQIFLIGGAEIFKEGLAIADKLYITYVNKCFECDVYFPTFENNYTKISSTICPNYTITEYIPIHPEYQYLNLIKDIFRNGSARIDRTGTGTLSVFGRQLRFPLNRFPLLTTKKTFFKGIAEELLWFLSGSTDNKVLTDKNIHIWDLNATPEFMKSRNLDYPPNQLGPIYGYQWRSFGGNYPEMNGKDQIKYVIDEIKSNPFSRRIILNSWNANDLDKMALPPCHVMCQFYVRNGYLDCQLYQRSGDVGLGVPFNIASYALLTYMIAHCVGLTPGEFIHTFGDTHIYSNHIKQLKLQIEREPYQFPTLEITDVTKDILSIKYSDLVLKDYVSHPGIKMEMSV